VLEFREGFLRGLWFYVIATLTSVAAAWWFGSDGLIPLMLLFERARPRRGTYRSVDLACLVAVERGLFVTVLVLRGGARQTIYRDELPGCLWAALRRGPTALVGLLTP
jgi:hypothetical protein